MGKKNRVEDDDDVVVVSDEEEEKVKPSPAKSKAKKRDDDSEVEILSDDDQPKRKQPAKKKKAKRDEEDEDSDVESEEEKPKRKSPAKKKVKRDEDSEEEGGDSKKKKKTKSTTTRKGTKIEFDGDDDLPKTKKELAAARKAAKAEQQFAIAGPDESQPVRMVLADDPIAIKYSKLTINLLKEWLRANDQLLSGTKDDLVVRCIDGEVNGRIPRCERCQKGKIAFNAEKGAYFCSGYFDEDARMMIRCSFNERTIQRQPWLNPEQAAANSESAGAAAQEDATTVTSSVNVTDEFVNSFVGLNPRDAAEKLTTFCRQELKLSLPEDQGKARQTVGALLMTNRIEGNAFDIRKIISALSTSHPPKSSGDAAGSAKKTSGPACKVAANEPIAALLDELAIYEKKKGGENVQFKIGALKKAALQVRGLAYEITDGTAMGKPGKTKVEGIGKNTAKTIQEFLDSGKTVSPYLEELKRAVGE